MITQREQLALKIQNLAGQIKTSNNNILCVGRKCNNQNYCYNIKRKTVA